MRNKHSVWFGKALAVFDASKPFPRLDMAHCENSSTATIRCQHTRNISQNNCVIFVVVEKTHRVKFSWNTGGRWDLLAESMMKNILHNGVICRIGDLAESSWAWTVAEVKSKASWCNDPSVPLKIAESNCKAAFSTDVYLLLRTSRPLNVACLLRPICHASANVIGHVTWYVLARR